MSQYKIIRKINERLYCKNSPITIEKYAFLYDSIKGKNMVQLKFRNISDKRIANIEILFQTIDSNQNLIEEFTHKFKAVNAEADTVFGDQEAIYFDGLNIENIRFNLKQVEFDDGRGEKNIGIFLPIESAKKLDTLGEFKTTYCQAIQEVCHCKSVKNVVTEKEIIWYCGCGNIQMPDARICRCCGAELDKIKQISNKEYLEKKANEIEEVKIRDKKRQEEQRKKIVKGVAAIFCILASLFLVKFSYGVILSQVEMHNKYRDALAAIENNEFDSARKLFAELDGYKDSEIQAKEIDNLEEEYKKQQAYNKAQDYLESKDYFEAITGFQSLGEFADSSNKVKECYYAWAQSYVKNGKYEEAIDTFEKAGDFGDAEEQLKKTKYLYAEIARSSGKFEKAIKLYKDLEQYEDSEELLSNTYFQAGCGAKDKGDFLEAINYFDNVNGKDKAKALELIGECKSLQVEKENRENYDLAIIKAADGDLHEAIEKLELLPEDYEDVATLKERLVELCNDKWIGIWESDSTVVDIKLCYKENEVFYNIICDRSTFNNCKLSNNTIVFYSVDDNINSGVHYSFNNNTTYKNEDGSSDSGGTAIRFNVDMIYSMKKMSLTFKSDSQIQLEKTIEKASTIFGDSGIENRTEILTKS